MSNNVVPFAGASLPSTEAFGKALTQHRAPAVATGSPFLRLLRQGMWVYGQQNVEVQKGSRWAINPYSLAEGFVAWGDGEKLGEQMARIFMGQPPINPQALPQVGADWEVQVGFDLKCLNGEDAGVEVQYLTNSLGGKRAYGTIVAALQAQYASDPEKMVPVIDLGMDSYTHKKYGQIFTPEFKVLEWMSMDGPQAAPEEPQEAEEPETEPEAPAEEEAAQAAPEPAQETKPADDGPVRRRRRRAE